MKFTAKRLIATVGVLGLLAAQSTAFAADEKKDVELYQDISFSGKSVHFNEGNFDLYSMEIGSGTVSSMKVPRGYVVTLLDITAKKTISLPAGEYDDLSSIGWNDLINRIEVKHYDALEYEKQAVRIAKTNEILKQKEAELGTSLRGRAIADKSDVNISNLKVEPVEGHREEKTELIFNGNTRLTNTTNEKQTLTSQAFDFSETNTISATTTNSIGTSISASATFNIPIVGNLNTTISTQYNFSKAETNSDSKTVTYKIPSQSITLNPGETVEVRARLEKVKTSGKVRLLGDISGHENGYIDIQRIVPIVDFVYVNTHPNETPYRWNSFKKAPYEISFDGQHVEGEGTYEAEYGSNLYIDVVNVDTNKTQTIQVTGNQAQADRSSNGNSSEFVANSSTFDMTK